MKITRRIFIKGCSLIILTPLFANNDKNFIKIDKFDNNRKKPDYTIRFAETTDVHGHIFPYDFVTGKYKSNSLAHIHSFTSKEIEKNKTSKNSYFMLIDNGDNLQGEPILNIYNDGIKNGTKSRYIVTDVQNFMGYEVGSIGNHDVEFGKKLYDNLKQNTNFPILSANCVIQGTQSKNDKDKPGDGSRKPYFANDKSNGAYIIKTFYPQSTPSIKVAIIGFTTPESKVFLENGDDNKNIYFEDIIESAKYWVEKINKNEKPDFIVALCHAGFDYKFTPGQDENSYRNYNPIQPLAKKVPQIDVIFWGHDHKIKEEVDINNTLLLGGNHFSRAVNIAEVTFTYDKKNKKYFVNKNGYYLEVYNDKRNNIPTRFVVDNKGNKTKHLKINLHPDKNFLNHFHKEFKEAKNLFTKTIIGRLKNKINIKDAIFTDSAFTDIIHHVEKYAAKKEFGIDADMTIAAPLKFSFDGNRYEIYGNLSYADMWNLYYYDNRYVVIKMSGKEIKRYLEYTYGLWFNTMKSDKDHLLNLKSSKNPEHPNHMVTSLIYFNMDSFAGIVYEVDVSKPKGNRINIKGIDKDYNGKVDGLFDLNKIYTVGVNSYRYGGGGGHFDAIGIDHKEMAKRTLFYSSSGLRDYLIKYIKEKSHGILEAKPIGNWQVIPKEWALKGRKKDEPLIF
jgi:2',3'-cyclic-nucleotide 2'-phosphodiesterase/3'-nucleotidase